MVCGDSIGATALQAIKNNGGTALVPCPENAPMPRAAIAAQYPNARSPVPKIEPFAGPFRGRHRTLPFGSQHRLAAPGRA